MFRGQKWRLAEKSRRLKQIYYNNRTNIQNTGVIQQLGMSFWYCLAAWRLLVFVFHPTNWTSMAQSLFLDGSRRRAIPKTHPAFPKMSWPCRHSPKKRCSRCQTMNLAPSRRVRAWGRWPFEVQRCWTRQTLTDWLEPGHTRPDLHTDKTRPTEARPSSAPQRELCISSTLLGDYLTECQVESICIEEE